MNDIETKLLELFSGRNLTLATAESCTGGLIANRITNISGSSKYFERGVITYSNQSKIELLNIPFQVIEEYGAVSQETAVAMAEGVRNLAKTDLGLAVTGIAGPTGGSPDKPIGLVHIALVSSKGIEHKKYKFCGSRLEIKKQTADEALKLLLNYITNHYY